MTTKDKHLDSVLADQQLKEGSDELKALRAHRADVDALLRKEFGSKLIIKYGGSKAKNTMIRDSYDLDVICYFESDSTSGGATLKDIYDNVKTALQADYTVAPKKSALRLKASKGREDFHIDVVPGRYTDEKKEDAYLYQNVEGKERLKTNLQTHIDHVKGSGNTDVISILKLLSHTYSLSVKTFVLELAVIEVLDDSKLTELTERVKAVLEKFRDDIDGVSVSDPANGNNDLSALWSDEVRKELARIAKQVLSIVSKSGWQEIFALKKNVSNERIKAVVRHPDVGTRPWLRNF